MSSETAIRELPPTPVGLDDEELEQRTMFTRNSITLEAQVEERPLAKELEEQEQDQKEEVQNQSGDANEPGGKGSEAAEAATDLTSQQVSHRHPAKALLRNDDYELRRVQSVRCFQPTSSFTDNRTIPGTSATRSSSPSIL